MWPLFNAVQFLVYIALYQISLTDDLRLVMKELKRIFLGEFFDDLHISDRIIRTFGGEPNDHGPD